MVSPIKTTTTIGINNRSYQIAGMYQLGPVTIYSARITSRRYVPIIQKGNILTAASIKTPADFKDRSVGVINHEGLSFFDPTSNKLLFHLTPPNSPAPKAALVFGKDPYAVHVNSDKNIPLQQLIDNKDYRMPTFLFDRHDTGDSSFRIRFYFGNLNLYDMQEVLSDEAKKTLIPKINNNNNTLNSWFYFTYRLDGTISEIKYEFQEPDCVHRGELKNPPFTWRKIGPFSKNVPPRGKSDLAPDILDSVVQHCQDHYVDNPKSVIEGLKRLSLADLVLVFDRIQPEASAHLLDQSLAYPHQKKSFNKSEMSLLLTEITPNTCGKILTALFKAPNENTFKILESLPEEIIVSAFNEIETFDEIPSLVEHLIDKTGIDFLNQFTIKKKAALVASLMIETIKTLLENDQHPLEYPLEVKKISYKDFLNIAQNLPKSMPADKKKAIIVLSEVHKMIMTEKAEKHAQRLPLRELLPLKLKYNKKTKNDPESRKIAAKVLSVEVDSSKALKKKAYRKLSFMFHPDKNPNDPEAEEIFKLVSEAYDFFNK